MSTAAEGLAQTRREIAADLRAKDRRKLVDLRQAVKVAQAHRAERLRSFRATAKRARKHHRLQVREHRRIALERLRAEIAHERAKFAQALLDRKARIVAEEGDAIERARKLLREERIEQRIARGREAGYKRRTSPGAVAKIAREESDDQVRANIPADLVSVFDAMRKRIKAGPRRSRTEAFLEWVEENPDEALQIQIAGANDDVSKMIRDYERHERELQAHTKAIRHPKRYSRAREHLARDLAAAG